MSTSCAKKQLRETERLKKEDYFQINQWPYYKLSSKKTKTKTKKLLGQKPKQAKD